MRVNLNAPGCLISVFPVDGVKADEHGIPYGGILNNIDHVGIILEGDELLVW